MGSGLLEDFNGEVPVPRWEVWAVGPPAFGFVVVGDADGEHGDRGILTYRGRCADRGPRAGALVRVSGRLGGDVRRVAAA